MPFFYPFVFMIIILPALVVLEGIKKFTSFLSKEKLWWKIPYALIAVLSVALIILLLLGYRY